MLNVSCKDFLLKQYLHVQLTLSDIQTTCHSSLPNQVNNQWNNADAQNLMIKLSSSLKGKFLRLFKQFV